MTLCIHQSLLQPRIVFAVRTMKTNRNNEFQIPLNILMQTNHNLGALAFSSNY